MSSFGAKPIYMANDSSFGHVQSVYYVRDPSFGNPQAVYMASDPSFGAQAVYIVSDPSFGYPLPIYMGSCLPKTELVHTSSNTYVPIGSLKLGDKISSWDIGRKKMKFTAVTKIHKYTVMDLICFNNSMQVSFTHPLLVMESEEDGILTPKWNVAFDIIVGDYVIGADGKLITIKSKIRYPHDSGIEVLNLSTDNGAPFFVGNSDNAYDNIEWADTPITQTLVA